MRCRFQKRRQKYDEEGKGLAKLKSTIIWSDSEAEEVEKAEEKKGGR